MFESGTPTCYICLRVAITDDLLINTDMGVPTIPKYTERTLLKSHKAKTVWV